MEETTTGGVSRRTIVKGAAWAAPVIAVAAATPFAAASTVPDASVAWGDSSGRLLALGLLGSDGSGSLVTASVLPFGPQNFTITNNGGAISGPLTAQINVSYSSGIPLLSAKGFGVYTADGVDSKTAYQETYQGIGIAGTYNTTQTLSLTGGVAAGGTRTVPVTFGLTQSGGLGLSVAVTFAVSLSLVDANSNTVGSASSTLVLPAGLNIL